MSFYRIKCYLTVYFWFHFSFLCGVHCCINTLPLSVSLIQMSHECIDLHSSLLMKHRFVLQVKDLKCCLSIFLTRFLEPTHISFSFVSECCVLLPHCLKIQYLSALPLDHSSTRTPFLFSCTFLQECYIKVATATAG